MLEGMRVGNPAVLAPYAASSVPKRPHHCRARIGHLAVICQGQDTVPGGSPRHDYPVGMAKLTYSENRSALFLTRLPSCEAGNDRGQLDGLHRLGHVHAVARRNRAQAILDASVRRERDGGRGATARAVERSFTVSGAPFREPGL